MNKLKKYNLYMLFILISFIFMGQRVDAEESSATCIYNFGKDNKFQYNISAKKYSTSHSLKMNGASVNDNLTKGDFINENGEFFCPDIYYTKGATGRELIYYFSGKKEKTSSVLEPSNKSKVNNIKDSDSNLQMCVYDHATFTVDTKAKEIVSYTAINCDRLSNGYTYDQIYSDGKCLLSSVNIVRDADRSGMVFCALTPDTNILGVKEQNKAETNEKYPDEEEIEDQRYNGKIYCSIFGENTWNFIKSMYKIIKNLIPVLIIVLGIVDFLRVVFSGEEKDMKASGTRFLKRILAGIIFILLPALILFLFNIVGFSEDCLQQLIK